MSWKDPTVHQAPPYPSHNFMHPQQTIFNKNTKNVPWGKTVLSVSEELHIQVYAEERNLSPIYLQKINSKSIINFSVRLETMKLLKKASEKHFTMLEREENFRKDYKTTEQK